MFINLKKYTIDISVIVYNNEYMIHAAHTLCESGGPAGGVMCGRLPVPADREPPAAETGESMTPKVIYERIPKNLRGAARHL
jgi:hypothetical protein